MIPAWRDQARRVLIGCYFQPSEQLSLFELVGITAPRSSEITQDLEAAIRTNAQCKGREARFRISVVSAYGYACALTGYRMTTISAGSIVDAAHIHQFADSRNNDSRNGISVAKTRTGCSIRACGRLQMITKSSWLLESMLRIVRTRRLLSITTGSGSDSQKTSRFIQIRSSWLGTARTSFSCFARGKAGSFDLEGNL